MGSSSKSVLIMGAVIIAILVMAVGMFVFNSAQSTISSSNTINYGDSLEDTDIEDEDEYEHLLFGKKRKILLQDMDLVQWEHHLRLDKEKLEHLLEESSKITPDRDAKLIDLKSIITLTLAITLIYGFVAGKIDGKDFLVYVTMVFTFYFAKKDDSKGGE